MISDTKIGLFCFRKKAYRSGLFKITKAAITPGTQPQSHNKNTIIIEPQPLSKTAKGGQIMDKITLQMLIDD